MQISAEIRQGEIVGIFDGNVFPIVGPGENSPIHHNGAPEATNIPGQDGEEYIVEVSQHTDKTASLNLLMTKNGTLIDFGDKVIPRGEEVQFDKLIIFHSI